MAPVNIRMESGDRFEFNWVPQYEYLSAPFEISPGVVLPVGAYPFTRWRVEGQTSEHRLLQVGSTTWFGNFYNGRLTQWQNYVKWTSCQGRLQLGITTENNFGRPETGRFCPAALAASVCLFLEPKPRADQLYSIRHGLAEPGEQYSAPLDRQAGE